MRVLITGARGLLGSAMTREFAHTGEVHALDRHQLDIAREASVNAAVADVKPTLIINCAAYNQVDRAEDDAEAALKVNALGVLALSRAAARSGATLVHYSTDFVFDGESERPYTEQDPPNPRGVYAASKLLGDWFALEDSCTYVLRVESLFGKQGAHGARRGSLATIVDHIRSGREVPVFVDRTVSPSCTADVARATRELIDAGAPAGLYHCVNTGAATWARIAEEAASILGVPARLKRLTLETAKLRAPRPRYCALSNAKLAAAGVYMPTWQEALRGFLVETMN
jgi:dTDP-4-dehydrorhamnose reductase